MPDTLLGHLTNADLVYLRQLHVMVVCDFRSSEERSRLADRWTKSPAVEEVWAPIGPGKDGSENAMRDFERALANNPQPAQIRQFMIESYRSFAMDGAPEFGKAFHEIVNGHTPFLFHCTAGKDRSGMFAAMLLLSLGVPRSVVMEDYLLSNQYTLTPEASDRMSRMFSASMPNSHPLKPDVVRVLLGVDREYLDAAFDAIDRRYGSFDRYRREALGVSDADVEALRAALLNP